MEKNRVRAVRSPGFLTAVMLAFAFLLTSNCSTAFAWAYYVPGLGWEDNAHSPPKDPQDSSTFSVRIWNSCIDAYTHAPVDCRFSMSTTEDTRPLVGVNGGHTHSRMIGTGAGTLSGIGAIQISPLEVRGQTFQTSNVKWDMPEMSGGYILKVVNVPPPNYTCSPDGSMAACTTFFQTQIVQADFQNWAFVSLPPPLPGGDYTFSGLPYLADGTPNYHTDNHYGTRKLVAAITKVAHRFKILTGRTLSVNDMSLPWGGLYDYKSTGNKPHTFHRKGESVDIDSKTVKVNQDITQPVDPDIQRILTDKFSDQDCTKQDEEPVHYDCQ